MRAVLLDWLIEVCDDSSIQAQAFYLAVNFVDRFFSVSRDARKADVQLVGVTCLFIAVKLEEVYPPTVTQFAELTDGACTADQILELEVNVLKVGSTTLPRPELRLVCRLSLMPV